MVKIVKRARGSGGGRGYNADRERWWGCTASFGMAAALDDEAETAQLVAEFEQSGYVVIPVRSSSPPVSPHFPSSWPATP